MKIALIALLTVAVTFDLTQEFDEAKVKMDLPNDSWSLADKRSGSMTAYIFKRQPIEDSSGRQIIPNIAVLIEDVDKKTDAITYSASKRIKTPFEVSDVFTHEKGTLMFKNAIGYKGKYVDQGGLEHTVYVVHAINEKKGLQIICDVTTNILDKVEPEFLAALKSIRK